ncbi:hypothetical protein JHK87_050201 [Glycine soja]|nr:hypothetical protein JHK87_050201 [Glycine soja]
MVQIISRHHDICINVSHITASSHSLSLILNIFQEQHKRSLEEFKKELSSQIFIQLSQMGSQYSPLIEVDLQALAARLSTKGSNVETADVDPSGDKYLPWDSCSVFYSAMLFSLFRALLPWDSCSMTNKVGKVIFQRAGELNVPVGFMCMKVHVKFGALFRVSRAQFPYLDLSLLLSHVVSHFGANRVMWSRSSATKAPDWLEAAIHDSKMDSMELQLVLLVGGIPHESKNIILQRKCHYRDISQAAPRPVVYGPQKQVSLRLIFGKDATPCTFFIMH